VANNAAPKRKRRILALTSAFVVAGSGVAFAWWSSAGAGDGAATTAASATKFVVTTGTQQGTLEPGSQVTVPFTVHNPGATQLKLADNVSVTFKNADGSAWTPPAGCDASAYSATGRLTLGAQSIDANADVAGVATITMANLSTDQSACMAASVPLHITVS
jgi:hypothetical protein